MDQLYLPKRPPTVKPRSPSTYLWAMLLPVSMKARPRDGPAWRAEDASLPTAVPRCAEPMRPIAFVGGPPPPRAEGGRHALGGAQALAGVVDQAQCGAARDGRRVERQAELRAVRQPCFLSVRVGAVRLPAR